MPTTEYVWDDVDDCVLEETDETGAVTVSYTHEPGPFGPLISEYRGGTTYTHYYDALGSTRLLTDDSGNITDTFEYDAWGNEVTRTGTTDTPYRWVGRWGYQYDSMLGSYYVRARSYQPIVARWISRDPLSVSFGTLVAQAYAYASNRVIILLDPSGLVPIVPNNTCDRKCTVNSFTFRTYGDAGLSNGPVRYYDKHGGMIGVIVLIDATFDEPCECCEYRQYIKGHMRARVRKSDSPEYGDWVYSSQIKDKVEDCIDAMKGKTKVKFCFGHRDSVFGNNATNDIYTKTRPTGCTYSGIDFPSMSRKNSKDTVAQLKKDGLVAQYEMFFDLFGQIIDVCNDAKVVSEKTLRLRYNVRVTGDTKFGDMWPKDVRDLEDLQ